jgi:hypothetical protein
MTIRSGIALLAALALPLIASGQESKRILPNDSSASVVRAFDARPLDSDFLTLSLLSSRTDPKLPPRPLYLSLSLSSTLDSRGLQKNLDISSMWQNEILKQEKYKTIRMILGSIEASTVAYLTYLHLKKYGPKY